MEAKSLLNELSISALQENPGENLNDLVNDLHHILGMPVDSSKVKFVRRVGKPVETGTRKRGRD